MERIPLGVRAVVDFGRISASLTDVAGKVDKLRSGIGCRDVKLRDLHQGKIAVDFRFMDPFHRPVLPYQLPAPSGPLLVVTGRDDDGMPTEESVWKHQLILGESGSGKSSKVWRIMQACQDAKIPVRWRVFDPKQVEFAMLEGSAHDYANKVSEFGTFLGRAFRSMNARGADMRARGVVRLQEPTGQDPLDILVIDELILTMGFARKQKVDTGQGVLPGDEALLTYLSVAAGMGHFVIAATQLPQKSVLDNIRDMFTSWTCLRVTSEAQARVATGDPNLYPAHQIPQGKAGDGVGFTFVDGRGVVKYRAAYLDTPARSRVGKRMKAETARLRAWRGEGGGS